MMNDTVFTRPIQPISDKLVDDLAQNPNAQIIDPTNCILCGDPADFVGLYVEASVVFEHRGLRDSDAIVYGLCPYCFLLPDKAGRVEGRLGV